MTDQQREGRWWCTMCRKKNVRRCSKMEKGIEKVETLGFTGNHPITMDNDMLREEWITYGWHRLSIHASFVPFQLNCLPKRRGRQSSSQCRVSAVSQCVQQPSSCRWHETWQTFVKRKKTTWKVLREQQAIERLSVKSKSIVVHREREKRREKISLHEWAR